MTAPSSSKPNTPIPVYFSRENSFSIPESPSSIPGTPSASYENTYKRFKVITLAILGNMFSTRENSRQRIINFLEVGQAFAQQAREIAQISRQIADRSKEIAQTKRKIESRTNVTEDPQKSEHYSSDKASNSSESDEMYEDSWSSDSLSKDSDCDSLPLNYEQQAIIDEKQAQEDEKQALEAEEKLSKYLPVIEEISINASNFNKFTNDFFSFFKEDNFLKAFAILSHPEKYSFNSKEALKDFLESCPGSSEDDFTKFSPEAPIDDSLFDKDSLSYAEGCLSRAAKFVEEKTLTAEQIKCAVLDLKQASAVLKKYKSSK
ncbi:MAG: hypothetical protein WCT85_01940 [Parachlamydiales bacterium]|jgi:hypothetical protein